MPRKNYGIKTQLNIHLFFLAVSNLITDKLQNILSLIAKYSGYIKFTPKKTTMLGENYEINTQVHARFVSFLFSSKLTNNTWIAKHFLLIAEYCGFIKICFKQTRLSGVSNAIVAILWHRS